MTHRFLLFLSLCILSFSLSAQAEDEAEIRADGIVVPTVDRMAVVAPSSGQLVFDVNTLSYWRYDGTVWRAVGDQLVGHMIQDSDASTSVMTEFDTIEQVLIRVDNEDRWKFQGRALTSLHPGGSMFIGNQSGQDASGTVNRNIGIGENTLSKINLGVQNIGIGSNALSKINNASANIALGNTAMGNSDSVYRNVSIGAYTMINLHDAQFNTAIGNNALEFLSSGEQNTAVGTFSLRVNKVGNYNTSVGYAAGHNAKGDRNVFLGFEAGYFETGSNKLYIANSNADSSKALLYGDFADSVLHVNGDLYSDELISDQLTVTGNSRLRGHIFLHALEGLGEDGTAYIQARDHSAHTSVGLQFRVTDNGSFNNALAINKDGQVNFQNREIYFGGDRMIHTSSSFNFFAGQGAAPNVTGTANTAIGSFSGRDLTTGSENTLLGQNAGNSLISGDFNTSVGTLAGSLVQSGNFNTYIGYKAGRFNDGDRNTALGTDAGKTSSGESYDRTISIGDRATAECNNCAVIGNSGSSAVNLGLGVSQPQSVLHVKQRNSGNARGIRIEHSDGTYWNTFVDTSDDYNFAHDGDLLAYIQSGSGSYVTTSDKSVKNSISAVGAVLPRVMGLSPKWYRYNSMSPDAPKVMGFIAQEVEEQFPGIVRQKGKLKTLAYDDFAIISIKAIQELNTVVEEQKSDINELQQSNEMLLTKNAELEQRLARVEALLAELPQEK